MKKSILTFLLVFAMIVANAQLGKNFATELKALIEADIATLKGDLIKKEEDKVITMSFFQCKLPLSGFDTKVILANFYRVRGTYKGKAALMDDIAIKLEALKKYYSILDSKTDSRLLSANSPEVLRKILLVDDAENIVAKIEQYSTDEISVNVEKDFRRKLSSELPKSTAATQLGANFLMELLNLISADVADIKGKEWSTGMVKTYFSKLPLSGFDVKLKQIFDEYTVVCKPEGKSAEATMDAIAAKLDGMKNRYIILDSKTKPNLFDLKNGTVALARRILVVDISENIKIAIQATEGYKEIELNIYKYNKPLTQK